MEPKVDLKDPSDLMPKVGAEKLTGKQLKNKAAS